MYSDSSLLEVIDDNGIYLCAWHQHHAIAIAIASSVAHGQVGRSRHALGLFNTKYCTTVGAIAVGPPPPTADAATTRTLYTYYTHGMRVSNSNEGWAQPILFCKLGRLGGGMVLVCWVKKNTCQTGDVSGHAAGRHPRVLCDE